MLNDRIKYLRNEKGESQKDLAIAIGVSTSTVGMWEQGRREPYLAEIEKIADYYNVDMEYLIRGRRTSYTPKAPMVPELVEIVDKLTPAQQRKLAGMATLMFGDADK